MERLSKFIASSGVASRRGAEALISQGEVAVNGKIITEQGVKIDPQKDEVRVNGDLVNKIAEAKIWLFNKPLSVVCTKKDEQGRETIYDYLPPDLQNLHYIGRLDINTEGLLLLTNSGEVKREFELPKNNFERVYTAKLFGDLPEEIFDNYLDSPLESIDPKTEQEVFYKFKALESQNIRSENPRKHYLSFILKEGKNREIRNICRHFGLHVISLKRTAYGRYKLHGLQSGEVREAKLERIS